MRVAHTGDLHVDENSRFEETVKVLKWMVSDMKAMEPDVITIGGDAAPVSVRRMTPRERNVLADMYCALSTICEVVIVPGNHDCDPEDVAIFQRLTSKYPITVLTRPGIHRLTRVPVSVYGIPYPSKGFLMDYLKDPTVDNVGELCRGAMKALLMGAKMEFAQTPDDFHVVLGHLNVSGSDVGGFTLVGQDVEVSAQDLMDTGADIALLSHIHKRQSWLGRVFYPGSPRRIDFGEEGETKGYMIADIEHPGAMPVVTFRETPCLTPMKTIRLEYVDDKLVGGDYYPAGAEVRVILTIDEDKTKVVTDEMILAHVDCPMAKSVTIERKTRPIQRVRAPEIQTATSDVERLKAYLGTIDPKVSEEVSGRLIEKMGLLA